ncbi:MBOAT family O-acyltransferase [Gillisia sp. Hel_I_29]|uniref:MBOAT family O-acyltransferase n=1 Tax=Gillisia sp. Hel_I_29 TaxID=1249975 RepID=UPI00054D6CE0|nr:MBOAT family O-acyltransferase [Gillisia sp. Hel_I_29]
MIFNSIPFLLFLPVIFILYWFIIKKVSYQNILLLVASYFFYGWWDYRFLLLIAGSTLVDYSIAIAIYKNEIKKWRKVLLFCSIACNLLLLGYFKYLNFFIESFIELGNSIGLSSDYNSLQIILPVGISFYTFQTLSYTIDVYRREIQPTSNFVVFATYVSFFPQLVAGPIERAKNLLPQFINPRKFDFHQAKSGIQLIIWGLFQKMVISDNCATFVNAIFDSYDRVDSLSLLLGAFYFAFQIYCDFAGYSNIAIGTARLFGFDLMRNFNYPYFSKNISEFWRRWHISLSTWFRDYLYIPLGGSRGSKFQQLRNVFIIFLVSGFWHGSNWTFIAWGGLHAIFFAPILLKRSRTNIMVKEKEHTATTFGDLIRILFTFFITCIAWVFFRSSTISDSFKYLKRIINNHSFKIEYLTIERYSVEMVLLILIFIIIEWFNKTKEQPLSGKFELLKTILILWMILLFGVFSNHSTFIYFQF